ncbi:EH domain-containing protein 3 [Salmo salar]|uniref:EH domain-containing protein 3 n=1 Tax=Salmo salar TaxID=8030 RepID=B5X2P2_SALSA|nr:EH domain-containing protein 3 [Salmo salar]ACI33573.1 EH domain-containing protein 3 [Salmo salar]|eukprot:NP_001133614.1 EH domain-containing protein 3 [Salmo salar]
MSGKIKSRIAANADSSGSVSCDERILRDCHQLYIDADSGLVAVAQSVGVTLLAPRKKITVMLMGNHSAGKSSFINWYVEEHIQRTGVAIETQGFSFVTSGRKRESLTGNATLHLYPHFKPLHELKGVSEYLGTEICTSRQKRFSLVTFVDSPGLVDGDMKYPFDVDQAIMWLGELCDLILVFFDPMGQALCKRTLNIVEKLNEKHGDRLRFYLSKADEAGGESDRQRVMMQIVQELCKRPGLNKCGFDMPTIYVPNPNKPSRCVNQIEEACRTIEKTINQTVQNTLNSLEKDCELITKAIGDTLSHDRQTSVENRRARCKGCVLALLGFSVPFMLMAALVLGSLSRELLEMALGHDGIEALSLYLTPVVRVFDSMSVEYQLYSCGGLIFLSFILLILARFSFRTRPTLSGRQKRQLQEKLDYVQEVVKTKKKKLYEEYLRQSVGDQDMD